MSILTVSHRTALDTAILLLRAAVGGILFIVGAGKVFGWFGGQGMEATIQGFVTHLHFTVFWAYVSTYTELVGGAFLVAGFLTRPAALAVAINMLVAGIVTLPMGFLATASYPFSLMVSAVVILLAGPQRFSVDEMIASRGERS